MVGANGTLPQSVGVYVLEALAVAAGDWYELASIVVCAGWHEVGLVMNGVPPTIPRSVKPSDVIVMSCGMPSTGTWLGRSVIVVSRPKSPGRSVTGNCTRMSGVTGARTPSA